VQSEQKHWASGGRRAHSATLAGNTTLAGGWCSATLAHVAPSGGSVLPDAAARAMLKAAVQATWHFLILDRSLLAISAHSIAFFAFTLR
jgi:hypothetical protein